ncbi:hypothetical protein OA78_1634 [Latilactobacillus curvatus]|nr:hypothetical protein OA78_1634 [Latilactobacillus curvatus]
MAIVITDLANSVKRRNMPQKARFNKKVVSL